MSWLMWSPYFFGASLPACHLRTSTCKRATLTFSGVALSAISRESLKSLSACASLAQAQEGRGAAQSQSEGAVSGAKAADNVPSGVEGFSDRSQGFACRGAIVQPCKIVLAGPKSVSDMEAERAICLELLFREELIACRLVGKGWIAPLVVQNVVLFVSCQRCFHVHEHALFAGVVENAADCAMRTGFVWDRHGRIVIWGQAMADLVRHASDVAPRQLDPHAEIDASVSFERHERGKPHGRIRFGIDRDDEFAAALQQLIHAQVLDMPAIGQI